MGLASGYFARDVPCELPEAVPEILTHPVPCRRRMCVPWVTPRGVHSVGSEIDSPGAAHALLGVGDDLKRFGHRGQAQVLECPLVRNDGVERVGSCLGQICLGIQQLL